MNKCSRAKTAWLHLFLRISGKNAAFFVYLHSIASAKPIEILLI